MGSFAFWGGILPDGLMQFSEIGANPTAAIKNLRLPTRGQGFGTALLDRWEQTLAQQGVTTFVATNVREEAMPFWEKRGYAIPREEEHKKVPYCMYKKIPSRVTSSGA